MSAEQGSSKVLTLSKSAPGVLDRAEFPHVLPPETTRQEDALRPTVPAQAGHPAGPPAPRT
ncbi:RNA polymerase sigma factor SigF, partial [Streptomyces sp. ZG43]